MAMVAAVTATTKMSFGNTVQASHDQQRNERRGLHHVRRVSVLEMRQLVRQDALDFFIAQRVHETPSQYDAP